jgi:ferredoxin-NADP reductase
MQERTVELIVTKRDELADDVVGLVLEEPSGVELPDWNPGAHIDLMLTDSLVRQYSLCSSPTDRRRWKVGILLDPNGRGGSKHVHHELHAGSRIQVRGPRNHFPLQRANRYQFIAGGIGITPMIPMIEAAEADGADWRLLYGGRQRSSMAFVDELSKYDERVTIWPQDERGLLDLASVLGSPRDDTLVYCCGPEGLLTAVEEACKTWPKTALHVERFAAKPAAQTPLLYAVDNFEVVCQRSGITVNVGSGGSILEALQAKGISMLASCMEGICGTCETAVLDGKPDHRDSVLSDDEKAENDCMMLCVSGSLSPRLVLDL